MKILVPLDGSPKSESVLPLARQLAERWQATIFALRVTEPSSLDPNSSEEYLALLKTRHKGLPLRTVHEVGSPATCIQAVAARENCEMILMATHGHDGVLRWLIGSVAEAVARHAPCPILLVRAPGVASHFREILIPTDGSEKSTSVAQHIGRFLSPETRVTLLHCGSDQNQAELRRQVEGRSWLQLEFSASPSPQGILEWLAGHDCDLIAMSTHGRDGLAHLWKGSVTEEVARHSKCPVLVFPPSYIGTES